MVQKEVINSWPVFYLLLNECRFSVVLWYTNMHLTSSFAAAISPTFPLLQSCWPWKAQFLNVQYTILISYSVWISSFWRNLSKSCFFKTTLYLVPEIRFLGHLHAPLIVLTQWGHGSELVRCVRPALVLLQQTLMRTEHVMTAGLRVLSTTWILHWNKKPFLPRFGDVISFPPSSSVIISLLT